MLREGVKKENKRRRDGEEKGETRKEEKVKEFGEAGRKTRGE
jgi:hypothetical protein